ncbi:MerR family transcriptional regulator [Nocardia jinanensis]|uniref:MerR family transcriptional regulator n=1 Tax=Nocardia jinanensis TaxID=382504 RepID=UPI0007C7EF31|nr:MerR family transcriptional regulator [Nocardia jinanensis]
MSKSGGVVRIGELSLRTGASRRSLRYYEQNRLLRSRRTANGWRDYDEADVHRVRRIAELLGHGLTVDGIRQLEACLDQHDPAECDDPARAVEVYRARLAVLDERLDRLREHRDSLWDSLGRIESGAAEPAPAGGPPVDLVPAADQTGR